jgi:hypothetical protein
LGRRLVLRSYWVDGSGNETPIDVMWELTDAQPSWLDPHEAGVSAGIEPSVPVSMGSALFGDDVLLLFDEGHPEALVRERVVRPVHSGSERLLIRARITPEGRPAELSVPVVVTYGDGRLGATNNQFDPFINSWADGYGFPPQHLKALIAQESPGFNLRQYRFEPVLWDYGAARLLIGSDAYLAPYRFAVPPNAGAGPFARGATLNEEDKDGRLHGPLLWLSDGTQSSCQPVDAGMWELPIWRVFLGSNGDPSDPIALPCPQRMNWEPIANIYTWDATPPASKPFGARESTWWFFHHQDYTAQTFVAASYGLTQVGYVTALRQMRWNRDDPDRRHWQNVVDSQTNIHLGARWLVFRVRESSREVEAARHRESQFDRLLSLMLCRYNTGNWIAACDYVAHVTPTVAGYEPLTAPEVR